MTRKTIKLIIVLMLSAMTATAQSWTADNGNGTYTNPLFYDEFSDPDVIRVGDDYYLAGTTMHCLPGVVVLHSKDLVNWRFCSYTMQDFFGLGDEFRLENGKEAYGQGIWAPSDITMASSISSRISTDMVCRCLYPTRLKDRGNIST